MIKCRQIPNIPKKPYLSIGAHVQTDEEIDAFVRQHSDSSYHPSCTCKMGDANDVMSVVDSSTRVKGTRNLRVVDASIMPSVVSGNLNGPVIMMAEKASDIIRGNLPLPRSDAKVFETPSTAQRWVEHSNNSGQFTGLTKTDHFNERFVSYTVFTWLTFHSFNFTIDSFTLWTLMFYLKRWALFWMEE